MRAIDDDEILSWWEAYEDRRHTLIRIAMRHGRTPTVIRRELERLGVSIRYEDRPANEQTLMDALARVGLPEDHIEHRHLPYAQALPHVKPGLHGRVPMSARQREMDRLGSGMWARIIRADMRREGLLPRR